MKFKNEEFDEGIMEKNIEFNNYSETSGSCFSSNKEESFKGSIVKNLHTTPKRLKNSKNPSDYGSLNQNIRSKKIMKNELSELKKMEIELAREMDSARSSRINSPEHRRNEQSLINKPDKISLLELEILTETINIDSKNNDPDSMIHDTLSFIENAKSIFVMLNSSKLQFPFDYYKNWVLEYNKIINNLNKEAINNHEYSLKLNVESNKFIRSLFYYFQNLAGLYYKEKKNNRKVLNNNMTLKQDNIKLSHLIKSKFGLTENDNCLIAEKILEMTIIPMEIKKTTVDAMVGPDNVISPDDNMNKHINSTDIFTDFSSNKSKQTLSKIDTINEISMLRTGRFQDAQNYRDGIMKITQEYNGLYDRTRNEYIERLLERQKNHDMEIKLMIASHKEDIDKMNDYFMEEKRKISEEHDRQLNELLQENKRKIDILKSDHSLELRLVQQKYKQIINDNNKEKDNYIQAFKIKFEHILIDMESSKDRELLNMQIEHEDKINELKENYNGIIDNLELELQRKELQFQEEKKMIINEFVTAHKREVELLKSQSMKPLNCFEEGIGDTLTTDINRFNVEIINDENFGKNKKDMIILSDDKKYNDIIKRLDNITSRSSLKIEGGKAEFSENKNIQTANSTAPSSAIPSNN
ncbi:hypothetical protein OJ252_3117, partial [Cryptosporidium canis]